MRWRTSENPYTEVTDFQGQIGGYYSGDLPEGYASVALNVRFDNGRVEPRFPFEKLAFTPRDEAGDSGVGAVVPNGNLGGICTTSWLNRPHILYTDETSLQLRIRNTDLYDALVFQAVNPQRVGKPWMVQLGRLLAVGSYNRANTANVDWANSPSQLVAISGANQVYDTDNTRGSSYAEPLLPDAKTDITPSTTDSAGTGMTTGVHNYGVVFQTKLGTYTKPFYGSPVWSVTVGADGIVEFTLTPATAWPAHYDKAYLVIAPVATPNTYYVYREKFGTIDAGTTNPCVITGVDVSDSTLATLDSSEIYDNLYRRLDSDPALEWTVTYGVQYGNRCVYVLNDSSGTANIALITSPGSHTNFDLVNSRLAVPEDAQITGAFVMNDTLWLSTRAGLFGYTDNGRDAVEWEDPSIVTEWQVGRSQSGIAVDSARRIAFITGSTGIRVFDGANILPQPLIRMGENPGTSGGVGYITYSDIACVQNENILYVIVPQYSYVVYPKANSSMWAIDYTDISNPKISTYSATAPDTGNLVPINGLWFGPIAADGLNEESCLVVAFNNSGTSFSSQTGIAKIRPRPIATWGAVTGDTLSGSEQDFAFDYTVPNIPGPRGGQDGDRASRMKFLVARFLLQNPLVANKTLSLSMLRLEAGQTATVSLTSYTPTATKASPEEITRNFSIPARNIGFRLHGNTRYGAWSLSRIRIWAQRWLR